MIGVRIAGGAFARLRRARCLISTTLTLAACYGAALAQPAPDTTKKELPAESSAPHSFFGVSAGLGWIMHDVAFEVYGPGNAICGMYEPGNAIKKLGSLTYTLPLPQQNLPLSLFLGLRANNLTDTLTSPIRPDTTRNQRTGKDSVALTRYEYIAGLRQATFSVGLIVDLPFHLYGGLAFAASLLDQPNGTITQERIIEPISDRWVSTNLLERPVYGYRAGFKQFVFGGDVILGARIPFQGRVSISPSIVLHVPFESISTDVDWFPRMIHGSFGLAYDLTGPEPPRLDTPLVAWMPPTLPDPIPSSRMPSLKAKITAKGINEKGVEYDDPVVEIEEAPWVEVVPVIPYVFFDSASLSIPHRYALLRNPADAEAYSVDSLLNVTPMDMHWQVLNVVGQRLRDEPGVVATIAGTDYGDMAGDDGVDLGRERAITVRNYLASIWGIDTVRLRVVSIPQPTSPSNNETGAGREENRRVELSFSSPSISAPVVIHRLAAVASPPAIKFYPSIVADTAVVDWNITVFQGDKELLRFDATSTARGQSGEQSKLWPLSDLRVNRDLTAFGYRLTVQDAVGQTAVAEGRFTVLERTHRRRVDSLGRQLELTQFNIVGFDYNSAAIHPRHAATIEQIAREMAGGSEVVVEGYTDRVGDPEHNRQLSLDRARAVAEALKNAGSRLKLQPATHVTAHGLGQHEQLFNNLLPEGRILSRMVRVTIGKYKGK